jgi:EAL and modified HD-GYP domain-containing signal transduction protein
MVDAIASQTQDHDVAFVARQPICDAEGTVKAYELLFRASEHDGDFKDGNLATSTVLLNTFVEIGLDRVVGSKKAFVNLTREFLIGEHPLPSRPDLLVVEVLEHIEIDEELIRGVQRLKRRGYTIALDDVAFRPELEPLLSVADIVKVDLRALPLEDLKEHCRQFRKWNVRLLAEKVETVEEFEVCRELGFELFQGYYISRPHVLQRVKSKTNKVVVLQLLNAMCSPQFSFSKLADIVKQDAGTLVPVLAVCQFGLSRSAVDPVD